MATGNSTPATIMVQLIIDVAYVKAKHTPSLNPSAPTQINPQDYLMVASDPRGPVQGNGSTALTLPANQKDNLGIYTTAGFPDIMDTVIPYNIDHIKGQNVIHTLQPTTLQYKGFEPDPTQGDGIPAKLVDQTMNRLDAWINQPGPAGITVDFGLYEFDMASKQQVLVGYYRCVPDITIVRP